MVKSTRPTWFTDNLGSIEFIVTSSRQNEAGLFETNLRDERYLPFEGQGGISLEGLRVGKLKDTACPAPVSEEHEPFTIYFGDKDIEDLWMAVWWGKEE